MHSVKLIYKALKRIILFYASNKVNGINYNSKFIIVYFCKSINN
jgi:hypothetical protein